jgi:hypothetical protein
MAFTYGEDLSNSRDFVRFHTGDTVEAESFLSDAIITSLISVKGGNEEAVIAAIEHIITRLSQPNFRADWLQVDYKAAREGYETMLKAKRREFGLNAITSSSSHTYRADSRQDTEPTFDNPVVFNNSDDDYIPRGGTWLI